MTPEERAEKVVEELDQIFYGERIRVIADFIRQAENDALERAANRVVEFLSGSAISKPIAEVIRFMKHEDID